MTNEQRKARALTRVAGKSREVHNPATEEIVLALAVMCACAGCGALLALMMGCAQPQPLGASYSTGSSGAHGSGLCGLLASHVHQWATLRVGPVLVSDANPCHIGPQLFARNPGMALDGWTSVSGNTLTLPARDGGFLPPEQASEFGLTPRRVAGPF